MLSLQILCIISSLVQAELGRPPLINVYNKFNGPVETNWNVFGVGKAPKENPIEDEETLNKWTEFKQKYGKRYESNEDSERLSIFAQNKRMIKEHNTQYDEGKTTYTMKINHLSDMRPEEWRRLLGYKCMASNSSEASSYMPPQDRKRLPRRKDWRKYGYVTKVKDQTGSLEGQHKRKTGKLISLSEQNLVDCDTKDHKCQGGWMDNAFDYVKHNHGIDTEDSYPYVGKNGTCKFKRKNVAAHCKGHANIESGDETMLKSAVATVGPISAAIHVGHSFMHYHRGVYYEPNCEGKSPNHAILVIGYGKKHRGGKYWLIKNSWNTHWGNKGFGKMSRDRGNNCAIASYATYPLV